MKKILLAAASAYISLSAAGQAYRMSPAPLETRWAKEVSPDNALKEYPRPQLERSQWQNLNGLWDYRITDTTDTATPQQYDGSILVPYPIESALSGVRKALQPDQYLWYRRSFSNPLRSRNKSGMTDHVLLHFGAVDYKTTVYVNGQEAGTHEGGYTGFTFDITGLLKPGDNELLVKVWDPSDQGYGPHGKQVLNPQGIYYTPSSGIWQTVWLESVPEQYIEQLTIIPDIDQKTVNVSVHSSANAPVVVTAAGKTQKGKTNSKIVIPVNDMHCWSPEDPYLYDLTVKMGKDEVRSYFGMRKISVQKDGKGYDRIFLNNKPYYNLGLLDQGFWPDGLYTAPTDEALKFDIEAEKAMGFNTIRKHIKVEPDRWYYWTDKLGMLVWQDMVNPNQGLPPGSKQAFEKENKEILAQLYNHPSITTWVLFNEKWGQYDQKRLTDELKAADPTRLVNGHTGELLYVNDRLRSPSPDAYIDADMTDVHSYPYPRMPLKQKNKAQVVGEFGGIGTFVPDHQWNSDNAWGYVQEKPADLQYKYEVMVQDLALLKAEGLSGSIYTQPFDVEGEQNGLMTYDREITKIPIPTLRQIHKLLNPYIDKTPEPTISIRDMDTANPIQTYQQLLQQYTDNKIQNRQSDKELLYRLSLSAAQAGDNETAYKAANEYIGQMQAPYSEQQMNYIKKFTKTTNDNGFKVMQQHEAAFKTTISERAYTTTLMNAVYHGIIEPATLTTDNPDWNNIREQTKSYGNAGEEILLRAETIYYLNKKEKEHYKPVAKEYLDKYGQYITNPQEKQTLENYLKD